MAEAATIGHNSGKVAEILHEEPKALFAEPSMLDELLVEIRQDIDASAVALETKSGRDAVASRAYKISKLKSKLDDAGKGLNDEHQKAVNAVNAVRKKARDNLDLLRDAAREPLTKWEQAEDDRVAAVERALKSIRDLAELPEGITSDEVGVRINALQDTAIDEDIFRDQLEDAQSQRLAAISSLSSAKERIAQAERDRLELQKLKAQQEEREREEQEKQAAAEAEKAEAARKAKIKADQDAVAARAAAEAASEAERIAQERIDEANRQKAEAERKLQASREEEAAAVRAEAARAADQKHRSDIMRASKAAMMDHGDVSEESAKKLVLAIIAGSIPSVTLKF